MEQLYKDTFERSLFQARIQYVTLSERLPLDEVELYERIWPPLPPPPPMDILSSPATPIVAYECTDDEIEVIPDSPYSRWSWDITCGQPQD